MQSVRRGNDYFGALTGVKLDIRDRKKKEKKKEDEGELWEMSRLQYHSNLGITPQEIDLDEEISDGDDVAVEISN